MRRSFNVEGLSHGANPIPAASVIGPFLATGAIFGVDPATGKLADTPEAQCELTFAIARRILQTAGADFNDVLKVTFFLRPETERDIVNVEWVKAFPDPNSRPARHVIVNDKLSPTMFLQCELLAVLPAPLG